MTGKKFLLGVGAHKAGTTWMWDYLTKRDEVDVGFQKEYHIFDAITLKACEVFRNKAEQRAMEILGQGFFGETPRQTLTQKMLFSTRPAKTGWKNKPVLQRLNFMANPSSYFDYFGGLLSRDGIDITCDITPSYSGLSGQTLTFIRDEFAARGVDVRPVFLMRDPVERLRSHAKMNFRIRKIVPTAEQEIKEMHAVCGSSDDLIRSSYNQTCDNLTKVFGDKVYFGFFETFFAEEPLRGLCDFLDLPYAPGDFDTKQNVSQSPNSFEVAQLAGFRKKYKKQYSYCQKRFGKDFIDGIWTR